MRTVFALIVGVAVGISLMALGVSIIVVGLGQPLSCGGAGNRSYCGNLPEFVGAFIVVAGVATFGGAIIYAVRAGEHSDSEFADD
jgi:hypothetical protein